MSEKFCWSHCKYLWAYSLQVTIGAGCFQEDVYTLEYGGLFDCKLTQYITIGCSVFFISVVVVVIITCYKCYRRRRSQQSQRRAESNRYELPSRPQQYTELPMRPESSGFGSQISSISIVRNRSVETDIDSLWKRNGQHIYSIFSFP